MIKYIPPGSVFKPVFLSSIGRYLPRWIQRAILTRRLNEEWIVLNFTNFPISRLGIRQGVSEICLFHNAYFMADPVAPSYNFSKYFYFREIFLRRFMLKWCLLFFDQNRTSIVVQTEYMAQLSGKLFIREKINVASLHVPPFFEKGLISETIIKLENEIRNAWFYPEVQNHIKIIIFLLISVKNQ